jgi:predicted DNA-binding transcriptional regulator YafY
MVSSNRRKPGRIARKYSQAARLHDLIRILEARYGATVTELVEECQVDRRTIYRDLRALEEAGYPLLKERQDDGHVLYGFIAGFSKVPPITFSLEELMTLYFCRGQLAFLQGTPFQDDLESIFARIRSSLPPRSVAHLERIAEASSPRLHGFKDYSRHRQLLSELRQALLKQQCCVIDYKPAKRPVERYPVDPYTLLFYKDGLYIGGYAHNRDSLRLFAIERIEGLEVLEKRFDLPEEYCVDQLTGTAFGLIDDAELIDLELYFSAEIAHLIEERIWHPQQRIEKNSDGSVVLKFQASGELEILSWIGSYLPHVRVLAPESLRQSFIRQLQETLELQTRLV